MKILILGHGRHGKDSFAQLLADITGIKFMSSSEAAGRIAVYPKLKDKYGYNSFEECFADRVNHRQEWKDIIREYNTPDETTLTRQILAENDCYVGMRHHEEYEATKPLFDRIYWVDASKRLPPDPSLTIEYDPETMIYIDNNKSFDDLVSVTMKL